MNLVAEINASTFFKTPFNSLLRPRQLCEYTIINIETISDHERRKFTGQGALSRKVRSYKDKSDDTPNNLSTIL